MKASTGGRAASASNPFGAILAGISETVPKKKSPPKAPAAKVVAGASKKQASSPSGTKKASSGSGPPATSKLTELKQALSKIETLTGGKLASKALFQQFLGASRAGGEQENVPPARSQNVKRSPPVVPAQQVPPAPEANAQEESEEDDFYLEEKPVAPKRQVRAQRYSLGVNRYSLPGGPLSTAMRMQRMSLGSAATLSPLNSHSTTSSLLLSANPVPEHQGSEGLDGNFTEFVTVGVDRAILSGFELPSRSRLQPPQLLDLFPVRDPANPASFIDNIAEHCFPNGVVLRLVTEPQEVERLTRAPPRDALHLLQFMDSSGKPTFALCLTVTELIDAPNEAVVEALLELSVMQRAADKIQRFFRRIASGELSRPGRVGKKPLLPPQTPAHNRSAAAVGSALMSRISAWSSLKTPAAPSSSSSSSWLGGPGTTSKAAAGGGGSMERTLHGGHISTPERLVYNPQGLAEFFSDGGEDEDEDDFSEDEGAGVGAGAGMRGLLSSYSEHIGEPQRLFARRRTASAASAALATPTPAVHKVLTQRAFCLLAARPLHPFLLRVLEAVAHKERHAGTDGGGGDAVMRASALLSLQVREFSRLRSFSSSSVSAAATARERSESASSVASAASVASSTADRLAGAAGGGGGGGGAGIVSDAYFFSRKPRRDRFLHMMRRLDLSSGGGGGGGDGWVEAPGSSYVRSFRVEAEGRAAALDEWTAAALFGLLPAAVVVRLQSLLLLERSLVVCGSDAGLVSTVCTGLALLLRPFAWEGCFVPLLPSSALEVLEAPVPFLVGVCSLALPSAVSSAAAVLFLDDYLGAKHRTSPRARFLQLPGDDDVRAAALSDPEKSADLAALVEAVEALAGPLRLSQEAKPSVRTATLRLVGFMLGMTAQERRAVRGLLSCVEGHNRRLCGAALLEPGGWRRFGQLDSSTGQWDFLPERFLAPMRARLAFAEGVVHTQLFVSLLDRLRQGCEEDEAAYFN